MASTSADPDIIDLTSDMDLAENRASTAFSPSSSSAKQILFNIHFDQQVYGILLPSSATIRNYIVQHFCLRQNNCSAYIFFRTIEKQGS